jgi:hypothetical protein
MNRLFFKRILFVELVIKALGASATSAQQAAGAMVFNQLAGNKYSAKSS